MAKDDITFQVGADTKDAQKSIQTFEKGAKRSFSNIEKAGKDIGKGFDSIRKGVGRATDSLFSLKGAIVGVLAGAGLVKFIDSVTDAAAVQETAIKSLSFALENSKDSSLAALEGFEQYASALQDSTGLADETALSIIGLAKSFGASDQSAKDFAAASIELAAVTGKTVEETSRQLVKSLGGLAGELGEISPIFKSLTAEQLKAGGAARAVLENFSGAAAAQLDTYAGSVSALGGRFGDLQEAFGRIITENPAVARVISSLSDAFKTLTKFVDDNADTIRRSFNKVLLETLKAARSLVRSLGILAQSFDLDVNNPFKSIADSIETIRNGIDTVTEKILEFQRQTGKVVEGQRPLIEQNDGKGFFENFFNTGQGVRDLKQATGDQVKILKERNEKIFKLQQDLANARAREKFPKAFVGFEIPKGAQSDAEKALDNLIKKLQEDADKKKIEVKLSGPKGGDSFTNIPTGEIFGPDIKIFRDQQKARADAVFKELLEKKKQNEEEAKRQQQARQEFVKKLISGIASAGEFLADTFLSAISGGFFNAISQGVQALIDIPKGFAEGAKGLETLIKQAPKIIDGIIKELPKTIDSLLKTFSKEFPKLVKSFAKALPVIIKQLTKALKSILGTIFEQLPSIFGSLLDGLDDLINSLPEIFGKLFEKLPAIFESILSRLPKLVSSIFNIADDLAKGFADALPGIIESFAENGDELAGSFIEGVLGSMGEVGAALIESFLIEGGAERIVGSILRSIPRIVGAVLSGVVKGLTRTFAAFASLITGTEVEFSEKKLDRILDNFANDFKAAFRNLLPNISDTFAKAGPDIANFIKGGFSEGLADFFSQLTDSFGEFTGSLGEKFTEVFDGFFAKLQEFFDVVFGIFRIFLDAIGRIFGNLGTAFSGLPDRLGTIFGNIGPTIGTSISTALSEFIPKLTAALSTTFSKITAPFQRLVAALDNLRSSLGGGKDQGGAAGFVQDLFAGDTGSLGSNFGIKKPKLALGGTVPGGFPTDNFPANLTSGELVVPRNDVTDLREFLASQRGAPQTANMEETNALLAQILGATGRDGNISLELDGEKLFNAILDGNRRGERLTA